MGDVERNVPESANGSAKPSVTGTARTETAVAVVCDGGHGSGPEIVHRLAVQGMRVVLATPWGADGRNVVDSLGALADMVAVREVDPTEDRSTAALALWLRRRLGRCDVLVNCTSTVDGSNPALNADLDTVRLSLERELLGSWRMAQAVVPFMRSRVNGRIVNVSDGNGTASDAGSFRVVTAAVGELTRVLAEELADHRVLVNAYVAGAGEVNAETVVRLATLPEGGPSGEVHLEHG